MHVFASLVGVHERTISTTGTTTSQMMKTLRMGGGWREKVSQANNYISGLCSMLFPTRCPVHHKKNHDSVRTEPTRWKGELQTSLVHEVTPSASLRQAFNLEVAVLAGFMRLCATRCRSATALLPTSASLTSHAGASLYFPQSQKNWPHQ